MKLQQLQNWSAKLIVCASKQEHASQYLQDLNWLPVDKRILYKMFLYVYECLNGFGPNYLTSSFSLYKQSHYNLCSAMDTSRLTVPKFKSKGLISAFNRRFFLTTPTLWSSLPSELRSAALLQASR